MITASSDLALNQYQTRLPLFEGPLDVLLHLIERQKLDISDISLVAVTDQFLDHIASLGHQAPQTIAEFTSVGTRLTVLKSRSLLPRPPVVDEESIPDPDDLVEQLKAYQRLKAAASALGERLEDGVSSYPSAGTGPIVKTRTAADTRLATYDARVLLRAVRRRLSAVPRTVQAIRTRRSVSLRAMTERVLRVVSGISPIHFSHVTADATTRTERATAFLAVLVLVRRGMVNAEQRGLFDEISLSRGNSDDQETLMDLETDFVN